jgi:hypothetical protein
MSSFKFFFLYPFKVDILVIPRMSALYIFPFFDNQVNVIIEPYFAEF